MYSNIRSHQRSHLTIMPGRRSKFLFTIASSSSSLLVPVPYVLMWIDTGLATPMAYATYTRGNKDVTFKSQMAPDQLEI